LHIAGESCKNRFLRLVLSKDKEGDNAMQVTRLLLLGICTFMLLAGGCTTYYKVSDPAGNKEYYTTKVKTKKSTGAFELKDAKSGANVTLQSSEVKEITEEEFNAAVKPEEKKP
jgi:hypothetical protein